MPSENMSAQLMDGCNWFCFCLPRSCSLASIPSRDQSNFVCQLVETKHQNAHDFQDIVVQQVFVFQPGNNKTPKHAHAEQTHAQTCNPTNVSLQNSLAQKCATDTICQVVSLSSDLYSRISKPKCEIRLLIYKGGIPNVEHDMDTEIHKDPTKMKCGFVSNNQVAADRRGGPRPRRRRKKNPNGDAADSSSRNQEHANTGGASASAAPSSASCAAALPDPVYVTVNPANQPGFNGQWRMKMPPWQEQEVFGPSGLLPHMDEEVEASAHDHQHPPTNQHQLPIGYGNGGQPQKGWPPLP
jgi:hypothetical protein